MSDSWRNTILLGDVRSTLRTLPARCIHAAITSPPYFALRSYLPADHPDKASEIGSESSLAEYIETQVAVFREVRRVLRDDGILYLNLGDSYGNDSKWGGQTGGKHIKHLHGETGIGRRATETGFDGQPMNVPFRVAEALRADGWWLRQTIAWVKKSPMPESLQGTSWRRCRVHLGKRAAAAGTYHAESTDGKPHGARNGKDFDSQAKWAPCPGCPRCIPNGGYVLRRGRGRFTSSFEYIFLFSKGFMKTDGWGRFGHISDEDARWIALFVETEGNISIKKSKPNDRCNFSYGAQVVVSNCFRGMLESLQRIVGDGKIYERAGKNSPVFNWQVSNKVAADLLVRIYPFLMAKHRQANLAIYLESIIGGKNKKRTEEKNATLERIYQANKSCNHFGEPDISWLPKPPQIRWAGGNYFFDLEAAKEQTTGGTHSRGSKMKPPKEHANTSAGNGHAGWTSGTPDPVETRIPRNVWTISTEPLKARHFAAFPSELVRRCLVTCAKDVCAACGAPHAPVVESERVPTRPGTNTKDGPRVPKGWATGDAPHDTVAHSTPEDEAAEREHRAQVAGMYSQSNGWKADEGDAVGQRSELSPNRDPQRHVARSTVTGYRPTCSCAAGTSPAVILDPYLGSGTTAQVARHFGRDWLGCEINEAYAAIARERIPQTPRCVLRALAKERKKAAPKQQTNERLLF